MRTQLNQPTYYTIREASRLTGLPSSTLRYYEAIGMIEPIRRGETSGHRMYSQADIDILDAVSCLSATGMKIEDMRTYILNLTDSIGHADDQKKLLQSQRDRLRKEAHYIGLRQRYVELKIHYWQAVKDRDEVSRRTIATEAKRLAGDLKKI